MDFKERGAPGRPPVRLLLAMLVSAALVACITVDMVNPVLPVLGAEFGASEARVGWVVSGVALMIAVGVPLYGRVSDFLNLQKLFLVALLVFAAGSLVCALAPNLLVLVLGRMLQGAGSAGIPVLSMVAVSRIMLPGDRGVALGLIAAGIGVGTATGPIFGGVVGEIFGWHSLFWITLGLSLALVPATLYILPDESPTDDSEGYRSFDAIGGILLGLAAGLFLFSVTQGQVAGFGSFSSWGSFLGSALASVGFVRRIFVAESPFVPPSLFANRAYVATLLIAFFAMLAYLATLVFVPLLVIEVNGLSPGEAGLVLLPGGAAVALFSPLSGRISDRIGAKIPVVVGLSTMGISAFFISTFAVGASPLLASAGVLGMGVGVAFTNPPANNAAASALSGEDIGVGLGIFQAALFLGAGSGPALIGAFLASRREADSEAVNPLYILDAAPFSDAFLAVTVAVFLALAAAFGLREKSRYDAP